MRLTRRHDVVVRPVLLEHQPHRPDVVGGVAPVLLGVEVAEGQLVLEFVGYARHPWVTLRVTNSRPRRGDSWLNRMPEEAWSR